MKYPAIYKSVEGSEYLYQNKDSYYCYERQLWDSSEPHHDCHHSDTNITAEYLANTYGEVKSKEHAEFIVKLAEVNSIQAVNQWREGLLFCFYYNSDGDLILAFYPEKSAKGDGEKQITIPLPPECEGGPFKNINPDNTETMKFDIPDKKEKSTSTFNPIEITFNVPNGLDISFDTIEQEVLGSDERKLIINVTDNRVYEYDDSSDDEWPKVGDEVQTSDGVGTVKLLPDSKGYYVISIKDEYYQYQFDELSKPKTPEQELRDELVELTLSHMENKDHPIEANAYYLVSEIIEKYITKKGEGDE